MQAAQGHAGPQLLEGFIHELHLLACRQKDDHFGAQVGLDEGPQDVHLLVKLTNHVSLHSTGWSAVQRPNTLVIQSPRNELTRHKALQPCQEHLQLIMSTQLTRLLVAVCSLLAAFCTCYCDELGTNCCHFDAEQCETQHQNEFVQPLPLCAFGAQATPLSAEWPMSNMTSDVTDFQLIYTGSEAYTAPLGHCIWLQHAKHDTSHATHAPEGGGWGRTNITYQ